MKMPSNAHALLALSIVLLATSAQGASYVDVDSTVVDPIQVRSEFGGGDHPYAGPNLQPSASIAAACSAGQNLSQTDLFRADLRDTDLSGCDLSDANLTGADLTGANLAGADLTGAVLTDVVSDDLGFWRAQSPLTTTADGAVSVHAADVDRDGDLDVLSASRNDNKVAWYRNEGQGNFSTSTITTAAEGARSVYTADLDGDGYRDILSASALDDKIAWYQNDERPYGQRGFSGEQIITTGLNTPWSVYAADLDGDGDRDVLSASRGDDTVVWYENDGTGSFPTEYVITSTAAVATSVYAADLDDDGDRDVLSASQGDDTVAWYRNDGTGSFSSEQVITDVADGARSVYAADLDGDGDLDVLSASIFDDKIAWYQNDGLGNFATQPSITTSADAASTVLAADVDGDGDLDVLSASFADDKIAWYQNDGQGNFQSRSPITTTADGAFSVHAADLDGDGDLDVLSASQNDATVAWYENVPPTLSAGVLLVNGYLVGPDVDLTGAELAGAELTGVDLSGADLAGANLSGADLTGADLAGADLTGADLSGATLTGITLVTSLSPASGPAAGGTLLTLVGGELGATAGSVTVDGNPCAISSWTDTSVSCSTPGGSGSDVPVILTTAGGQAANTVFFAYDLPIPILNSLSPTTGPEAGGTTITILGRDFGVSPGSVTVGGVTCPVLTWNDGEITCTLPAGTGADVPVLVVDAVGTSSNTALFSYVAAPPPAVPGLGAIGAALLVSMLGAVSGRRAWADAGSREAPPR